MSGNVSSGTVSGTTVYSGQIDLVYSSGAFAYTTIAAGGELIPYSGGAAYDTIVDGGAGGPGVLFVQTGGAIYETTVNSGGQVYVEGGSGAVASASGGTVSGDGTLYVNSGGAAFDITVNNGGSETVSGGNGYAAENYAGTVNSGGNLYIDSAGTDYGTTINAAGNVYVSGGGSASAEIVNGGILTISSGGVDSGTTETIGQIIVDSGGKDYAGTIGEFLLNSGGKTYGETVDSGGSIYVYSGGADSGSTVNSGGGIYVSSGASEFNVTISGGSLSLFEGAVTSGSLTFSGAQQGILQIGLGESNIGATISGYASNDTIQLSGLSYNSAVSLTVVGDAVTVTSGSAVYNMDIAGASSLGLQLTGDGGADTLLEAGLCYLRGTSILTPTGAVPIENLQIGDLVVTRFNNFQPIKWIGRQSYDSRITRADNSQIPVRIRAGALAPNQPARDLYVSPGHSMLIGNTLVLASSLVNGVSITQDEAPETIEYFQIELAMHDCIIAEGAWSETFADGPGLREQFHNHAEFCALYPRHRPPETVSLCAPRPEQGEKLAAAIAPIAARAAAGLPVGKLRGVFEKIEMDWKISGWAMDESHPDLPVLLEVVAEDQVIGTVLACDYRRDLQAAGLGRGHCAFTYNAPERLRPAQLASLHIRRAADGAPLWSMAAAAAVEETPRQGLRLVA